MQGLLGPTQPTGLLDNDTRSVGLLGVAGALLTPASRGGGFAAVPRAIQQAMMWQAQNRQHQAGLSLQRQGLDIQRQRAMALQQQVALGQKKAAQEARARQIMIDRINASQGGKPGAEPGAFPLSLKDVMTIKALGGPDYLEAYKYAMTPQKRDAGNYYVDPMTGEERYFDEIPEGMRLGPDGSMQPIPGYGRTAAQHEAMKAGAVENAKLPAFRQQEAYKARLDPLRYVDDDGNQYVTNRFDALSGGPAGRGDLRTGVSPFSQTQTEKIAGSLADLYTDLQGRAMDANGQLGRLDRVEQLLRNSGGGAWMPLARESASIANSFGIKLDPSLGDKEAAEALAVEMANAMRQPGTGPMTDKDFENFRRTVPDLAKSPQGREQIFTTMRGFLRRDKHEAEMARKYRERYGRIDESFFSQLEEWRGRNPIFRTSGGASGGY